MDQIALQPGMVIMGYHDVGSHQVQRGQLRLVQRVQYENAPGVDIDRFAWWIVEDIEELMQGEDIPLNDRSWIIDEHAPFEVMFAAPENFDPEDHLVANRFG